MNILRNLIGALALVPALALADVQHDSVADTPIPQSIWRSEADGSSTHLQSEWRCAHDVNGFQKTRVIAYDQAGFDVSCNYVDRQHSVITVYLTRRVGRTITDDFEEARRELVSFAPKASLLPDAQEKDIALALPWQRIIFSEDSGAVHSGIWLADLNGWTLEFRATYETAAEQAVLDEMTTITRAAQETAGQHLAMCAKSQIPLRNGAVVTSKDEIQSAMMMHTLIGAVGEGAAAERKTGENAPRRLIWCAEDLVAGTPMLVWHAVFDDGADASADRVTTATLGEPPMLMSGPDELMKALKVGKEGNNSQPQWFVSLQNGKQTWFFAIYAGRPPAEALASMMKAILDRKAKAIGGYSTDGKNITINMPDSD
jgi:hypothetical protein